LKFGYSQISSLCKIKIIQQKIHEYSIGFNIRRNRLDLICSKEFPVSENIKSTIQKITKKNKFDIF
jgi:hypothetical protein